MIFTSTRELAKHIFDRLSPEQLQGFVLMFKNKIMYDQDGNILNDESITAIEESERMISEPNLKTYKSFQEFVDEVEKEMENE